VAGLQAGWPKNCCLIAAGTRYLSSPKHLSWHQGPHSLLFSGILRGLFPEVNVTNVSS